MLFWGRGGGGVLCYLKHYFCVFCLFVAVSVCVFVRLLLFLPTVHKKNRPIKTEMCIKILMTYFHKHIACVINVNVKIYG